MERYDLVDIWRLKFPDIVTFTWSNKDNTRFSRIDFWLVSKHLKEQDMTVDIIPCPLSDHKAIYISIKLSPSDQGRKAKFWKLNNSLLQSEEVQSRISYLISFFYKKAKVDNSFCLNWELFKHESAKTLGSMEANLLKLEN